MTIGWALVESLPARSVFVGLCPWNVDYVTSSLYCFKKYSVVIPYFSGSLFLFFALVKARQGLKLTKTEQEILEEEAGEGN